MMRVRAKPGGCTCHVLSYARQAADHLKPPEEPGAADDTDNGRGTGDQSVSAEDRKDRRRQELLAARRRGQAGCCAALCCAA